MRDLKLITKDKCILYDELIKFGFIKYDDYYKFNKIINNKFNMEVIISDKIQTSRLIDLKMNDEYILVDTSSYGEYVGHIKDEYESVINDIINNCFKSNYFNNNQTIDVINYIKNKYNDDIEYLWEDDPSGIFRCKTNNKWYGIIMKIPKRKIIGNSEELVDVIDLKHEKNNTLDNNIYPGYHMNKKSWISIILDNSLSNEELFKYIDNSYSLVSGNNLDNKVFEYLLTIPKGKVVTYKMVAEYLGNKGLARVVGNILHKNPDGDKYPCYKVLNSKGNLAKEFVFGGYDEQKKRLESEGIEVVDNKVDLDKYLWK